MYVSVFCLDRLLNRRNLAGYTALHCAAWGGHAAAVALLLDANACCNPSSDGVFDAYMPAPPGSTPLHLAAAQGQVEVALGLLKHYVSVT
jgi:ankyrin repeat protein